MIAVTEAAAAIIDVYGRKMLVSKTYPSSLKLFVNVDRRGVRSAMVLFSQNATNRVARKMGLFERTSIGVQGGSSRFRASKYLQSVVSVASIYSQDRIPSKSCLTKAIGSSGSFAPIC